MSHSPKISATHLGRNAYVYVRQSTEHQVQNNLQSQERQYELADRAVRSGWPRERVVVIDDDLGRSGSSAAGRTGFARLVAEVALSKAGIVLGLEVSRLARNNRDWYQLLDLCSLTSTLIGDADGVYDPACFNDRLLLGLKGTMSEAELHVLQGRMLAGLQHKASKGELKFHLPPGYQFDQSGGIIKSPDEQVRQMIDLVFTKVFEIGSVSGVLQHLLEVDLRFPRKAAFDKDVRWIRPYYRAIYDTLTNPIYTGTYVWGRSKIVKAIDESGLSHARQKKQPIEKWQVMIKEHHPAYISWDNFLRIRKMIEKNRPAKADEASRALREGGAWLQGLAWCGKCGRPMRVRYHGKSGVSYPYYVCCGAMMFGGALCQSVGGRRIDDAVARHFLENVAPAQIEIEIETLRRCHSESDPVLEQFDLELERARYVADRIGRQYGAVEPENRIVARTLESQWNEALGHVQEVGEKIAERRRHRSGCLCAVEEERIKCLVHDLAFLWNAPTTTDKDRKQLLRAVLEQVQIRKEGRDVHLRIVWKGGAVVEESVRLPNIPERGKSNAPVVELVRELTKRHTDAQIARILIRKGIKTSRGLTFNAHRVAGVRLNHGIACYRESNDRKELCFTVDEVAQRLRVSRHTIYLWLKTGILKGDQLTESAPWTVYLGDEDEKRLTATNAPLGWLALDEAASVCRVTKQTVLNWVKQKKIAFVYVTNGRRRSIRVDVVSMGYSAQCALFSEPS